MRIAFITPEYITEEKYDGGLANYLSRVGPALVALGHEVTIVVRSSVNEEISLDGVKVCRIAIGGPPLFFLNAILRDIRVPLDWLWQSWKINRELKIIHGCEHFDLIQYASYTAPALFRLKGVPAVIRLSSYEPLWQYGAGTTPSLALRMQSLLEKIALKRADALFSPSEFVARSAEQQLGRPVTVIESPFIASRLAEDTKPYEDLLAGKKYLLFFGSICRLKGAGTIAAMLEKLLETHHDLFFVFVGKDLGFRGRPMMEHLWEQSGSCRGRVLYLGKLRQAQLVPILKKAVGVVLPSLVDNLPNTCIEAMAAGKVVIGTIGTSFEQLIVDGSSGLLCPPDDPAALRTVIETLLRGDTGWREDIGRKAQARILELSGHKVINELLELYSRCLSGKKQ